MDEIFLQIWPLDKPAGQRCKVPEVRLTVVKIEIVYGSKTMEIFLSDRQVSVDKPLQFINEERH